MSVYCLIKGIQFYIQQLDLIIAIGRKRHIAINKISADPVTRFLHSKNAANHNHHMFLLCKL